MTLARHIANRAVETKARFQQVEGCVGWKSKMVEAAASVANSYKWFSCKGKERENGNLKICFLFKMEEVWNAND